MRFLRKGILGGTALKRLIYVQDERENDDTSWQSCSNLMTAMRNRCNFRALFLVASKSLLPSLLHCLLDDVFLGGFGW